LTRSTFTIYEEFRLLDKEVIDSIVKPFSYSRQAKYMQDEQYKHQKHLIEEPKEVYISSAYYKQHWTYDFLKQVIKMMLEGKNAGVIFYDYLVTIEAGIKTENQIEKEKQTMSTETFEQEYCNLILGAGENSFFNFNHFNKSRKLSHALYPQREMEYNPRKNPYDNLKRGDGTIFLLSCDLALRSGSKNDNTIMELFRLIPVKKRGYIRELLYIESHNGLHSALQTLRIKQLVEDFSVDIVSVDVQNFGFTIYEQLGMVTRDEKRNKEYPPFTVIDHPSIDQKLHDDCVRATLGVGAIKNIYPISASQKFNSDISILLKDRLKKGMFSFLKNESDAEDILMKNKTYLEETKDDSYLKNWYILPFLQTSLMIQEVLGLEMVLGSAGTIKLVEKAGQRKDRFSALAYGNYVASLFDQELLREAEDRNDWDALESCTFIL
jgi:hypothetical protein